MKVSQVFPSKFIKAADLNGRSFTLTIARVALEEMGFGADKERKPVAYFAEAQKGMVLNRTNAVAIAGLYGDETDQWAGKRITIFPAQVRAFGATHDVLRVRAEIPAQPKPAPAPDTVIEESQLEDAEDYLDDHPFDDDDTGS